MTETTAKTAREWVAIVGVEVPALGEIQTARAVRIGEPTTYAKAWELAMQALSTTPGALSASVEAVQNVDTHRPPAR